MTSAVTMAEQRTTPEAIQRSAGEHPVVRVDDVLLSRGERGTWLIDLKIPRKGGSVSANPDWQASCYRSPRLGAAQQRRVVLTSAQRSAARRSAYRRPPRPGTLEL